MHRCCFGQAAALVRDRAAARAWREGAQLMAGEHRRDRWRRYWDKALASYDRQMRFYDRVLLADGRPWVCAQATGHTLEVAIGTGLNLPLYPAAVGLPATLGVVSRQTAYDPTITRPLLEACIATCKSCGDECARHAPTSSTAGPANKPAAAASKPAGSCWLS
jgi:hypothetical protein